MKSKIWITGFLVLIVLPLAFVASWVIKVDPYFHYHKPNTDAYYYSLSNQRSQNDGISRNFEYEGIITGTSMTENFKTSEADRIFDCNFIKIPYSGGTFKEINDSLSVAINHNPNLKIIIRGLDMSKFIEDKDAMREDLGEYPTYLYNNNPFDDVKYLFNRDVIFKTVYEMVSSNDKEGFKPGMTDFDEYSNWMSSYSFGVHTLYPDGTPVTDLSMEQEALSDTEKEMLLGNIRQNITSLAEQNPDISFHYFIPPYSAGWWQSIINAGLFTKQLNAEQLLIEEILKTENIKLYSFNNLTEITTDLNNYKDLTHYGEWINSLLLRLMKEDSNLLTKDNYKDYLSAEEKFYWSFAYQEVFDMQDDYEQDYYAAALINKDIYGISPYSFKEDDYTAAKLELKNSKIVMDQHDGKMGIECRGRLRRSSGSDIKVADYIRDNNEYCGCKMTINDIERYQYLVVYGKKVSNHGQPGIYIYDKNGKVLMQKKAAYKDLDKEWHQYLIDVSSLSENVDIVFHGGYVDDTGSADSKFIFSDITLY